MTHASFCWLVCLLFGLGLALSARCVRADDWPQWRGPNRDGVWRETGLLEKFADKQIKIRWRQPISSGYSGPTVAGSRVFVSDRVVEPKQVERVHAFDWKTGQPLWIHAYDCEYAKVGYTAGPRASVTLDDGRAYSLGSMGHLFCLEADSGKVLWSKDCLDQYKIRMPIWGIAASPLVENDVLIVQIGGEGACLVGFDKRSGEERWRALDDDASYSAPIVIEQAGRRVLVSWTGENVVGLNPKSGEVFWKHPFKPAKMVINIATPVRDKDRLFFTSFYDGALMLELKSDQLGVNQLWRRSGRDEQHTDSLHSIISTPYLEGDYVYGVDSYGEFRCLDAKTGDRVWESLDPTPKSRWSTIHMVRNGAVMWMFNERGELMISKLSPRGYEEISRAKLIEPTRVQLPQRGGVCWSHPAYAHQHVFARNDEELVCASLAAGEN
ncbi:MAG: PQQ-like beta-propeller repeat protein [Planctomycetia bacterium]|nr:PQQ-like beta-propeller repeat protein [Planctomycetia bacterium]